MKKVLICLAFVFLANIIWGQNIYTTPEQDQIRIDICSLLSQDKNTEALNLIKREISKCEQETVCDTEHYANMLYLLATYYCQQKDYDAAYAPAQKALIVFSKVISPICPLGYECASICTLHFYLNGDASGFAELFSSWSSISEAQYGSDSCENEQLHTQTCFWLLQLKFADALRLIVDESYDCFVAVKSNLSQDVSLARSADYSTIFKYLGRMEMVVEIYGSTDIKSVDTKQSQSAQALCSLYNNVASVYEEFHQWDKAVAIYEKMDNLFPSLTHDEQDQLFDDIYPSLAYAYSRIKDFPNSISTYEKCLAYYKNTPDQLAKTYNDLGVMYEKRKDSAKAVDCFEKAVDLYSKSNQLNECAPILINMADAYAKLGKYTLAEGFANNAIRLYGLGQRPDKVAHCYDVLASIYSSKGEHRRERHAYIEAAKNYQDAFNTQNFDLNTLLRAAEAFKNADELEDRIAVNEKIVEFLKSDIAGNNSAIWIRYENEIIKDYITLGKAGLALRRLDAISDFCTTTFGDTSMDYAGFLYTKATALHEIDSFAEEVDMYKKICDILETLNAQEKLPKMYLSLAIAYQCIGEFEKAQDYYNKTLTHPWSDDSYISSALINKSICLFYTCKYSEAQDAMNTGMKMSQKVYGKNTYDYYIDQYILAKLLVNAGQYEDANKIFKHIEKGFIKGCNPKDKLDFYNWYSWASILNGKKSVVSQSVLLNQLRGLVSDNLPLLTPKQRSSYLKLAYMTKNNLFNFSSDISASILYDCSLIVKGISTGTAINIRQMVEASDSPELQRLYGVYMSLQKDLSYMSSRGELADDEIIKSYNKAESDFLSSLRDYDELKSLYQLTSSDIEKALPDKSCSVEFIAYSGTDGDIYYSAVVQEKGMLPFSIKLFSTSQLSAILNGDTPFYSLSDTTKSELYEVIWAKILRQLGEIETIYFSPDGFLHNIPLEFLPGPHSGKLMSESYRMVRLSSTRNISSANSLSQYKRACIYGGLDYNSNPEEIALWAKRYSENEDIFAPADTLRSGWGYLPGTKKEADVVSRILSDSGLSVSVFTGAEGCEESIKSVHQLSPDILHIATHGFYIPMNADTSESEDISFMTRSGLIMSRSQDQNRHSAMEDGILTAAEIECINLYNTQLAVLSACETGLGDITYDGVIGLQSAFKVAGVRTILLSLWKVDDNATQLMMTAFYKTLMQTRNKQEAFEKARNAVRTEYPDPYYWAGFIMLD